VKTWERIAKRIDTETAPVHRLTKKELAQRLGISRPALGRRLNGKVDWHVDEIETLAKLFDTTYEDLTSPQPGESEGDDAA
jgi:transcriptional regulator with XRE-family HTH domain